MMTYKLAYSTNAYTRWKLVDAVADIRRLGFDGVELLADVPHAFPPLRDEALSSLREAAEGLGISNLNGNTFLDSFEPSLIDPDPVVRHRRVAYTLGTIDLARLLGGSCVCTCTGHLPSGTDAEGAGGFLKESLSEILEYAARDPQVRVGIEYEPGLYIEDARGLLRLLDEVAHPLLGVNLDLGHAVCKGEDPAETIEALKGRIWNIHIEDIKGRVHEHLVPGLGDIDFGRIRGALDRIGYDRFVTLEIYTCKDDPSGSGARALEHLRRFF